MFGALPASVFLSINRSMGVMTQIELPLDCPPWFFIDPSFICSVPHTIKQYSSSGTLYSSYGLVDHPSFELLRSRLESQGYIKTERNWSNGDTVVAPFYLNNWLFIEGDRFLSASAMSHQDVVTTNYNGGDIDATIKNYRDDEGELW